MLKTTAKICKASCFSTPVEDFPNPCSVVILWMNALVIHNNSTANTVFIHFLNSRNCFINRYFSKHDKSPERHLWEWHDFCYIYVFIFSGIQGKNPTSHINCATVSIIILLVYTNIIKRKDLYFCLLWINTKSNWPIFKILSLIECCIIAE